MQHSTLTDDELRRAAAALLYVKEHGNAMECIEFMHSAAREWHEDHRETHGQRESLAFWLAADLKRHFRQPEQRCKAAAEAAIVGSVERAMFDELLRYARALRAQIEAKPARRSA